MAFPGSSHSEQDARTGVEEFRFESALRASQQAIGREPSDWAFTDGAGRALTLGDLRGKPLVLSLVFTSCNSVCPTATRHLAGVVEKARDALGKDSFRVALLGFDAANDTPMAMQQYARQHGVHDDGWELLSADDETIRGLTRELGFAWYASANGFDHIAQVTVIDADGVVYRQVYGEAFATPSLVEPLVQLVLNRPQAEDSVLGDIVNRVRFFCTAYDPARDAYFFDYSLFIGMIIGALVIIGTLVFMLREYLHARRCRRVIRQT